MSHFTPIASLLGGLLIGLSAAALLLLDGQVAAMSGVVAGLLRPVRGELSWRVLFFVGLVGGGVVMRLVRPESFGPSVRHSGVALAVAGLCVGFGARLGHGCTSGHGVCGTSRLSLRSITATAIFMVVGAATVFAVNRLFGGAL